MSENILQKIIDQKKIKIEKLKREIDIDSLIETINEKDVFFDFKKKIQENINYNISVFKSAKLLDNFANSKKINIKVIKNNEKLRYFAIDKNFKVIKKYNNSDYYALIVGDLANKIKNIY